MDFCNSNTRGDRAASARTLDRLDPYSVGRCSHFLLDVCIECIMFNAKFIILNPKFINFHTNRYQGSRLSLSMQSPQGGP